MNDFRQTWLKSGSLITFEKIGVLITFNIHDASIVQKKHLRSLKSTLWRDTAKKCIVVECECYVPRHNTTIRIRDK